MNAGIPSLTNIRQNFVPFFFLPTIDFRSTSKPDWAFIRHFHLEFCPNVFFVGLRRVCLKVSTSVRNPRKKVVHLYRGRHAMHIPCTLYAPYIHLIICTLYAHYMHIIYTLYAR